MAKTNKTSKANQQRKEVKAVSKAKTPKFVPQYYTAYPAYNEFKKIKGLVLDIEGTKYYINIINPVITEKKIGDKVIYSRKEFNVCTMPPEKK